MQRDDQGNKDPNSRTLIFEKNTILGEKKQSLAGWKAVRAKQAIKFCKKRLFQLPRD